MNIIAGTVSVGEEEWRRTMSVLEVAKSKGQHIWKELMNSFWKSVITFSEITKLIHRKGSHILAISS